MEDILIQELEQACLQFFMSNSELDRKSADEKLSVFFSKTENFSLFFFLSCNSTMQELQFLSIKAVLKHIHKQWNTFSLTDQLSLFKQLFGLIFSDSNPNPKPNYIQAALCKTFSVICRLSWFEIVCECNLISEIKALVYRNRKNLFAALIFFQEILNEISQTGHYRSLSIQKKVFSSFQEQMFGEIFDFCAGLLKNFSGFDKIELENLLETVKSCLTFEYVEGSDIVEGGWKDMLEGIFRFIEEFLFRADCGENFVGKAVILLGKLGNAKKVWLGEGVNEFIDRYLQVTAGVLGQKNLSSDVLIEFIKSLRHFFEYFTLKKISESRLFVDWLKSLHSFTISQFTNPESIISQYRSVFFLWNFLSNESHLIDLDTISLTVVSLFEPFVNFTLENANNELILNNISSIVEHLDLLSGFSLYFLSEFLQVLTKFYPILVENWGKYRNTQNQAKLAWLLLISSAFLLCKSTSSSVTQNNFILQQVLIIVQNSENSEVALSLACAIYLTNYAKIWVNVAEDNTYDSSEDNENLNESISLLEKIVVFIFSHMQVNSHLIVVNYVLDLFEYLAKGHFSAKILVQVSTIQDFSYNFLNYPLCLHDSKLRSKVFHVLACIWLHDQSTEELNSLLLPYEQAFISNSNRNPEFFEFLFREIQGICSAIVTKNEFFSWFIEKLDFFISICSELFLEEQAINAFLKMIIEVTDSRGSRIQFPESSANGIIMFKKISPLLVNYTEYISSNYSQIPNFLGKCKRVVGIMKNFLTGGYICFGVFQVFDDPCFINSILSTFNILSKLVYSEITTYIKLLDFIYEYFEALVKTHSQLLLGILKPEYLDLLFLYLQNGIRSQNIKYCISSANSLTCISEEIINSLNSNNQQVRLLVNSLESALINILETLLETIILEDSNFMWSLSKPLLGFIIINEQVFEKVCKEAINEIKANNEFKEQLSGCLGNLMAGVNRNMKSKNREIFAKNFSLLRNLINTRNLA